MQAYIKNKNQLLSLFLIVGFFIGIIYLNIAAKDNAFVSQLFQKSVLKRLADTMVVTESYFLYILKERAVLILVLLLLGGIRWKKPLVCICMVMTGFFGGMLLAASVIQLGPAGILIYVMGMLPQLIFYGAAVGMLFIHWFEFPKRQWNGTKTIFVLVMFAVGIITEAYVNPWLVKSIIKII